MKVRPCFLVIKVNQWHDERMTSYYVRLYTLGPHDDQTSTTHNTTRSHEEIKNSYVLRLIEQTMRRPIVY